MKKALAKMLFPNLPRVESMRRVNTMIIVTVFSVVGGFLVVALMLTRNAQIGK